MKISELRELLKDKRVIEEINKHLWIESQKVGYSIGIERATDEWLRFYAEGWLRYNKPSVYAKREKKRAKKTAVKAKKKASSTRKKPITTKKKASAPKKKASVPKKKVVAPKKKKKV